ncbi:MAG: MFS transporter family glucose-6-phosphate receptor UhpC [Candidatus Endonucleobacter bathymodioli]|uniref:MFS transporter family glucose-6-phosphate receptor UhpC n=1 Tax=Candidatus Endonucleibacter bathymodioli TaxID=539814 RepID=A0AA90SMY6_9GAMM|nr:MFS transporter family glucose-6-phosphate receptor UhpC [Candidatus Endonucleobacter bathymodioli]
MFRLFRAPQEVPVISDPEIVDQRYKYWRIHIMFTMYVGYATFYFTRKSFNFAMPAMIEELGMDKADIGILATLFYVIYGCSKFVSGVVSDRANPRFFMGVGLIATGVINIFFGMSSSLIAFALLWGLNAFFQGWGWPPCSKLLTFWYSCSERGRWWSVWNTAHNFGGALIPIIVGFCALHFGWRYGLIVPGIIGIIIGMFLCWRLRDKPSTMGLPTIGQWRNDELEKAHEGRSKGLTAIEILRDHVFTNKLIWVLGFASILVYIVRTAMNDWGNLYLTEVHGFDLVTANSAVTFFEIGGFLGSLVAGWGSDKFFKGSRGPMNFIFALGVLLASIIFLWEPSSSYIVLTACFFFIGFFIFGPQMLLGMAAAEHSDKEAAGAATGFIGLFSYAGAALAGYPIAKIVEYYQWSGFFIVITISAAITAALLLFFVDLAQRKQVGSSD